MSDKTPQETIDKAGALFASAFAVLLGIGAASADAAAPPASTGKGKGRQRRAQRRPKGDAPAAPAAPKDDGPKIEDVRKKVLDVIEEFGNDGATEVLEEFGVKKISELDAAQYPAVIEAATKYLLDDDGGNAAD